MNKIKKWLGNLGVVLLLAAILGVWIMLPWQGVLAAAVVLTLWLGLTRRGRQTLAVAGVGIASLGQRWGASSVIIIGIAGVVGVLVAMLAMGEGFQATLKGTGSFNAGKGTTIMLSLTMPDHEPEQVRFKLD